MKVAIIGNQGFSMLNFRGPLIGDLVHRGHSVYALAPQLEKDTADSLRRIGAQPVSIALARTGTNPLTDLLSIWQLRQGLRQIRPDVTLGYAAKPVIYGTLAAWLAGVPRRFAMIEGLGYIFIYSPGESLAKRALRQIVVGLFRASLSKAQTVFFLNPDDIAEFSARGLIKPGQAVNIGGIGVDLSQWAPAAPVLDPITFLFVGRLLKDKGVLDFVAAAREIKALHPRVRFVLVGGLDENPQSISLGDVEGWVAEGLVEWPGHVPVQPWLQQASVFVLPSYREGVPRSTQEAMAMSRPVITTDAVGCRETVVDGKNGYLVPIQDPKALADAMLKFISTPELIVSMGQQSRAMAEERFDVRKVNATIMNVLGI